jgi:hypothetical protein
MTKPLSNRWGEPLTGIEKKKLKRQRTLPKSNNTVVDRGRLADYAKHVQHIDPRVRINAPNETMELLSESFTPGNWDVICQGGKESYDHGKSWFGSLM